MSNFDKITETPEALAAFLAALPVANGRGIRNFTRSIAPIAFTWGATVARTAHSGITRCGG